jgi:hypothetical protein
VMIVEEKPRSDLRGAKDVAYRRCDRLSPVIVFDHATSGLRVLPMWTVAVAVADSRLVLALAGVSWDRDLRRAEGRCGTSPAVPDSG